MKVKEKITVSEGILSIEDAYDFIKTVDRYESNIFWHKGNCKSNGKSILGLVSFFLTLKKDDAIFLTVEGKDAETAMNKCLEYFSPGSQPPQNAVSKLL